MRHIAPPSFKLSVHKKLVAKDGELERASTAIIKLNERF